MRSREVGTRLVFNQENVNRFSHRPHNQTHPLENCRNASEQRFTGVCRAIMERVPESSSRNNWPFCSRCSTCPVVPPFLGLDSGLDPGQPSALLLAVRLRGWAEQREPRRRAARLPQLTPPLHHTQTLIAPLEAPRRPQQCCCYYLSHMQSLWWSLQSWKGVCVSVCVRAPESLTSRGCLSTQPIVTPMKLWLLTLHHQLSDISVFLHLLFHHLSKSLFSVWWKDETQASVSCVGRIRRSDVVHTSTSH